MRHGAEERRKFRDDDRCWIGESPTSPLSLAWPAATLAACTLEQWKQYIEMRKLVCIVGQPRRWGDGGVRLSLCPSVFHPRPAFSFPRARFSLRVLCLLPFVSVEHPRVLYSLLLFFSLSLFFSSSLFLFRFSFPCVRAPPSRFFLCEKRRTGSASFPIARLKERIVNRRMSRGFRNGDCSIRRELLCCCRHAVARPRNASISN